MLLTAEFLAVYCPYEKEAGKAQEVSRFQAHCQDRNTFDVSRTCGIWKSRGAGWSNAFGLDALASEGVRWAKLDGEGGDRTPRATVPSCGL